ncbi:MAG: hypothetical protein Q4D58_08775 [Synergistaceae bacterium]|nr:hypothetical protein [Synergistaceae bacterium]
MTSTIEIIDEKTTKLNISFADEDIDLECAIEVAGDEAAALAYAPFFEADMRRQYADLFPQPDPIVTPDTPFEGETGEIE